MICRDGSVRSRQVKTQERVTPEITEVAKEALNKCFTGITPDQVNLNTVLEFENELGEYKSFASVLLRVVNEMFNSFDSEKVHIEQIKLAAADEIRQKLAEWSEGE
jgi:transcriptional regulator of heat shock response